MVQDCEELLDKIRFCANKAVSEARQGVSFVFFVTLRTDNQDMFSHLINLSRLDCVNRCVV